MALSDFQAGRKKGFEEGRIEARKEVLSYLEQKYMNPEIERGSVEGDAILALTRELAKFLKVGDGN